MSESQRPEQSQLETAVFHRDIQKPCQVTGSFFISPFQMDALPLFLFRRKFSPEEDDVLRALVSEHGIGDWSLIAAKMLDRDARQCKERWFHYLTPCLNQKPWTHTEDILLEAKVAEFGNRWKYFEFFFPGRSDVSIKNRYNVLMRRQRREIAMTPESPKSPSALSALKDEEFDWESEEYEWNNDFSA
jgi:hypothetical protein